MKGMIVLSIVWMASRAAWLESRNDLPSAHPNSCYNTCFSFCSVIFFTSIVSWLSVTTVVAFRLH